VTPTRVKSRADKAVCKRRRTPGCRRAWDRDPRVIEDTLVAAIIDGERMQKDHHTVIGGHIPRKIAKRPVKEVRVHARLGLFFPRLDPVLDRRKRHKDAVVAPQVPTRRAVGTPSSTTSRTARSITRWV